MFIDLRDFYIKLDNFGGKIKYAESEFTKLATELGSAMKKGIKLPPEVVDKIVTNISETYHSLGEYYEDTKKEFNYVLNQFNEVYSSLKSLKEELSNKKEEEMERAFLLKANKIYSDAVFAYSLYIEICAKLDNTLNDFAGVIGQVKGIIEITKGFQGEKIISMEEIEKIQHSVGEFTWRYIW